MCVCVCVSLKWTKLSTFSDLNLLDWSVNNQLAVCLGGSVYLWNASTGNIQQLLQMEGPEEYVGSVAWIKEGNYLAVGGSSGDVQVGAFLFRRFVQQI